MSNDELAVTVTMTFPVRDVAAAIDAVDFIHERMTDSASWDHWSPSKVSLTAHLGSDFLMEVRRAQA